MSPAATPAPRTAAAAIEALARAVASTQPGGGTLDDWEHADAIMRALTEQGYRISHTDPGDTGESRAIEAQAAPPAALRAALEHYDERIDPERSTGEMTAREWRDAYFALARIALKELEQARALLRSLGDPKPEEDR